MSTSAVPKKMNSQSSTKKLSSSFILLSSLLILLAAASLAEAAIDVFNDDECNYNPMRKPPRFGKRSHNGKQQAEVAIVATVASQFFYSSQSMSDRNVRMLIVLTPLLLLFRYSGRPDRRRPAGHRPGGPGPSYRTGLLRLGLPSSTFLELHSRSAASPHAARLARRLCAGQPPEDQRQSEALPQDDRGEC